MIPYLYAVIVWTVKEDYGVRGGDTASGKGTVHAWYKTRAEADYAALKLSQSGEFGHAVAIKMM